jgi:hypothetical protein
LKTTPQDVSDNYTWGELEGLYKLWEFRPPLEVVIAAYFQFPEPVSDEEPEWMETEDAVRLFQSVGFSVGAR